MLAKCVNPVCSVQFLFLHQGKLFEVETQYRDDRPRDAHREARNGKVKVERYWLCNKCAKEVDLSFDKRKGLVVHSLVGWRQIVTPVFPASAETVAEISRVLIRPFDINLTARRNSIVSARAKAKEAA